MAKKNVSVNEVVEVVEPTVVENDVVVAADLKMTELVMSIVDGTGSKSSKMKELYELGFPVKEIAVMMGVRYNFVYNVISNQCLMSGVEIRKSSTTSKKDIVWKMLDEGKTVKEICVDLKTNINYVYKLRKEWVANVIEEIVEEKEVK